jgi:hypothetical protein
MVVSEREKENPWLILTSGVSQLVTAVAALLHLGETLQGAQALSILWVFNDAMDRALSEAGNLLGVEYSGNFPGGLTGPDARHDHPSLEDSPIAEAKHRVSQRLLAQRPELSRFVGWRIVIPARPDCPQDILVLSALCPSAVLMIADGIQNDAIVRRDFGSRWRGYDATLRSLPTDAAVWCPSYLEQDCRYIGVPSVIPPDQYESVLHVVFNSPLGQRLARFAAPGGSPVKSIVLSQHLALSGLCSEQDELAYYQDIISGLRHLGQTPVLFKTHPRDQEKKLNALRDACSGSELIITDDAAACVPVECLSPLFVHQSVEVIGTTSSAMLGTVVWGKHVKPFIVDADYLPADLRTRIMRFAVRHGLPIRRLNRFADDRADIGPAIYRKDELEASLAQLSAAHSELNRRYATLQELLASERSAYAREFSEATAESGRRDWERRAWRVAAIALSRPVVVWGAGEGGRTTVEWLQRLGARVPMIVDGDSAKVGTTIHDVRVESPSQLRLMAERGEKPFVVVASVYAAEIEASLAHIVKLDRKDYELLGEVGRRPLPGLWP